MLLAGCSLFGAAGQMSGNFRVHGFVSLQKYDAFTLTAPKFHRGTNWKAVMAQKLKTSQSTFKI